MEFNKQRISIILFASTYVAIFTQILGVFFTFDSENYSYLSYLKFIFWILSILAIWSHHKASSTDPGRVTHEINSIVLEFYINLHDIPIKRAEKFNQSYGKMLFEKMDDEDKKESEDAESENSDEDDHPYEQITSISDQVMERISKDYKIELKRCNSCHVVKTPGTHHCSFCRGCIMKRNHHCPWINNCVGQFNQKFFLQFCWYCMLGCGLAGYITCYYLIYKNKKEFLSRRFLIFIVAIQLIFCLIFYIFTIAMLWNQWNLIYNDTTLVDMKQKKFLEKRDVSEVINETFGGGFGIHWFLPIKPGGYRPFFLNLKNRREF